MRLTVRDVAKLLNVSEKTIYRWVSNGEIPSYRLKEQYRFSKAEILEWATAKRMPLSEEMLSPPEEDTAPLPDVAQAIKAGGIFYRVGGADKASVLKSIVDTLRLPDDVDRDFLLRILLAREAQGSTGIGEGIAIPHVRNPIVLAGASPSITLSFLENPIDFGAIDGVPVRILFTIISSTIRMHLHLLSRLAFILHDADCKAAVIGEASRDELFAHFARVEGKLTSSGVATSTPAEAK
jgi:nitrogen PTS system EIIA component